MESNDLVNQIRARFDHESQKRILREKYEAAMLFAHEGGMWRAGPELQITLIACQEDEVVLKDLYENPVKVRVSDLLQLSQQRWQEQMNAWLSEYENLLQRR